jgi:hypothetical protein
MGTATMAKEIKTLLVLSSCLPPMQSWACPDAIVGGTKDLTIRIKNFVYPHLHFIVASF